MELTLRCAFCRTLNGVDVEKAEQRPKCGECGRPMLLDRPVKVEEEDFDRTVLKSQVPVLVDFYADWCAPCRILAPMMDEIAGDNIGRLVVAKVDTDRAPQVSQQYGIRSIPTVVMFKGGEEVGRSVGIEPERLKAMIEAAAA